MLKHIEKSALILAQASSGNPVLSVATIILFYVMFNTLLAMCEKLIFGERFEHFLDPLFAIAFIVMAAYSVWMCAVFNARSK